MMTNPFWQLIFTPGLKIKRWVVAGVLGIMALGYGMASVVRGLLFRQNVKGREVILAATFQWIPNPYRDIGLIVLGITLTMLSFAALLRVLTAPFGVPRSSREWASALMLYQRLHTGPTITVIGSGEHLISTLQDIKHITSNLTVIFIPESTDAWQDEDSILHAASPYIFSLANSDMLTEQVLLQPIRENGLACIGDVLLATAAETAGDIEGGLRGIGKILALSGQVVPAVCPDPIGHTVRPSHEAVCALMDTDYLIMAPHSLEALVALLAHQPALAHAIKLSRSIRLVLPPPEPYQEQARESLPAQLEELSDRLGENEVQFALVDAKANFTTGGPHDPKEPATVSGIRLIQLRVDDPAEAEEQGLIEALRGIHQTYGLKRYRRWRI
jgi:hypothetical protein